MKWLHTLLSIGTLVVTAISPVLSTQIGAHPTLALTLGAVWAILGHLLPSPIAAGSGPVGTMGGTASGQ